MWVLVFGRTKEGWSVIQGKALFLGQPFTWLDDLGPSPTSAGAAPTSNSWTLDPPPSRAPLWSGGSYPQDDRTWGRVPFLLLLSPSSPCRFLVHGSHVHAHGGDSKSEISNRVEPWEEWNRLSVAFSSIDMILTTLWAMLNQGNRSHHERGYM
jgi:hypothetical protein